jgi:histidinol-phosphate aminotransferase
MFDPETLVRPHLRAIEAYQPILPFEVLGEQLGFPPERIVKLDANENPYGPLPEVRQALGRLRFAHIYPDPGASALRREISRLIGVPEEHLLAGAGADELIALLVTLLLDPGDCLINCPPTFGMYAFDAAVHGARVVAVPRRPDFSLDLDAILRAAERERPKLVFLATPNNPDGSLATRDVVDRLLELEAVVVLDEAYVEFAPPHESRIAEVPERDNLVVLRTFSKWAGLAGLRVGYGAFPAGLVPHLWNIKQPYTVSVAASTAALESLQHVAALQRRGARLVAERERLAGALGELPFLSPYPSHANFILCRVVGRDAGELKEALAQKGVLVRYFSSPGLDDHIRVSVGTPEQTNRLLTVLKGGAGAGGAAPSTPKQKGL